ncbi:hypothetical protein [Devosia sp. A369]
MSIRVITPPAPFVLPSDIAGDHAADDAAVAAMIEAVTETIDGYTGWLGQCLGPQLLEWSMRAWPRRDDFCFPVGPELEIDSVAYVDPNGDEQTWAFPEPLYFENLPAVRGRRSDIRIRYWAGYGARDAADPTKWVAAVPERARQAVILSVQHMKALGTESLFLRSEEVEGIGTKTYTVSDQAGAIIRTTADRLLAGLWVPKL